MQDKAVVQDIARLLYDRKGERIVALDIRKLTPIADYMIIASGRNTNQVKALADDVDDRMNELGIPARRSEGQSDGRWVVLDYGNFLVEIFHREEREFYQLERLWEDADNRIELGFDADAD